MVDACQNPGTDWRRPNGEQVTLWQSERAIMLYAVLTACTVFNLHIPEYTVTLLPLPPVTTPTCSSVFTHFIHTELCGYYWDNMEPLGVSYVLDNSTELLIKFTTWLLYRRMTLCQMSREVTQPKMYGWGRGVRERNRDRTREWGKQGSNSYEHS